MREPDEVAAMIRLRGLGWGCVGPRRRWDAAPVRRYVPARGRAAYRTPERAGAPDEHACRDAWNRLMQKPEPIASVTQRSWAKQPVIG